MRTSFHALGTFVCIVNTCFRVLGRAAASRLTLPTFHFCLTLTASRGPVSKLQAEVRALSGSGVSSRATLEHVNRCEQQFPHGSGMCGIYSFVAESAVCRRSCYWVFAIDCAHQPDCLCHKRQKHPRGAGREQNVGTCTPLDEGQNESQPHHDPCLLPLCYLLSYPRNIYPAWCAAAHDSSIMECLPSIKNHTLENIFLGNHISTT